MRKTRKTLVGLLSLSVGVLVLGVAMFTTTRTTAADTSSAHPNVLTNASEQQVGVVSLAQVKRDFAVRSGTPQVVYTRRITREDAATLNIGTISRTTIEEPPLMLVIIKGDLSDPKFIGIAIGGPSRQFQYVAYVYDLWAGGPTLITASPTGGEFRIALNDSTLPAVPVRAVPSASIPSPAPLHHYGATLSGITPPHGSSTPTAAPTKP